MIESDKIKFAELMTGAGELYNKQVSKALMKLYFSALEKMTIEEFEKALNQHITNITNGQYFPKPADLLRDLAHKEISTEDSAIIAWQLIERAVASVGAYGTLKLDDKIALAAIKSMGTWQQFCHTDREKMAFKRQEFLANYKSIANYPPEHLPTELLGIEETHNRRLENKSYGAIDLQKLIK